MARTSTKEDKSIYQLAREDAGMTRAEASEALEFISESSLEKIENKKTTAKPEDVMAMASAYKCPELCNRYCSTECAIGKVTVPSIKARSLSEISLSVLSTLNSLEHEKDRLIEITEDGIISDDELEDFKRIQNQLSKISITADTLQMWVQKALASGEFPTSS
ncbi:MAG: helix-turn-helix domain-containing protein [Lachnospiraceae bacterium]|nr:helix-turn-helix domain-containing protein [Lachnospiraceae bacterium]